MRTSYNLLKNKGFFMSNIKKRVGVRIFEFRRGAKLSQAELAERADLSIDSISRIERGLRAPSYEALERLADALGVKVKDFFNFEGKDFAVVAKYNHEVLKLCNYLNDKDNKSIKYLGKIAKIICEE
jgi:transcriptional regulator with XRE-family HTH domain